MALPAPPDVEALIRATDRWFLRRGIPHFIDRYRAGHDVFTRTLPVLALVVLLEVLGAANLAWRWWQNALAVVAGGAVLVGAWAGVNRLRGRSGLARPDHVGPVELAAFVLLPPLLPLLFGAQAGSAVATAAANAALLGVIYLVTSYGLVPLTRWALGQTVRQIGAVLDLFGRALPLLLLFSVALFVNTEVWQVSAALDGVLFWITMAFFGLVGLLFLLVRLPAELASLRTELTPDALVDACDGTPVGPVAAAVVASGAAEPVPLGRRQQGNVLLVLLFSQAVQVLLVTVTVAGFFFVFGLIAIRPEVVDAWLGGSIGPGELASWTWFGHDVVVTRALVHVAGFLGVVSGFYFTICVITDATYRAEFFTEVVAEVRQSLAVRTVYLALVGGSGAEGRLGE
ncbi:MAG: hypothetical protein KF703_04520 [Actinobacteria bacterium]|nr:hypothetical protein [Actinomycetota bacterium]